MTSGADISAAAGAPALIDAEAELGGHGDATPARVAGSAASACPTISSECPVPYVGAVSISVTPASIAACSARMLSASSTHPIPRARPSKVNGPPRAHVPTPTADSCRPPAPSERVSVVVVLIATPDQLVVQRSKRPAVVGDPAASANREVAAAAQCRPLRLW